MNGLTGSSQWDFPTDAAKTEELNGNQGTQTQTPPQEDVHSSSTSTGGCFLFCNVCCWLLRENDQKSKNVHENKPLEF